MSSTRYHQIKRVKKANNNYEIGDRRNEDFNLAHKFNLVYDCFVNNLNEMIKCAYLDQTIDESS